jgi:signal transduction histidine kinase
MYSVAFPGAEFNRDEAEAEVKLYLELSKGRPLPTIVDIRNAHSVSLEARSLFSKDCAKWSTGIAFLVSSPRSMIMANLFMYFNSPQVPAKAFTDEASALCWLKDLKNDRAIPRKASSPKPASHFLLQKLAAHRRRRVLLILMSGTGFVSLLVSVVSFASKDYALTARGTIMATASLVLCILQRRLQKTILIGNIFISFVFAVCAEISWASGGIHSPIMPALLLLPLYSLFILDKRSTFVCCFVCWGWLTLLVLLLESPYVKDQNISNWFFLDFAVAIQLSILVTVIMFEQISDEAKKILQAFHSEAVTTIDTALNLLSNLHKGPAAPKVKPNMQFPMFCELISGIQMIHEQLGALAKERENSSELRLKTEKLALIGEMTAGIAHELKNPLNLIGLRSEQIARLFEAKKPKVGMACQFLSEIDDAVTQINQIIDSMRSLSRDGLNDPTVDVPISKVLQSLLILCQGKCERHGIELDLLHITNDLVINCRPGQVVQILLNYVLNAFDAVKQSDTKRITVGFEVHKDIVQLFVEDTGCGIPMENQKYIFEQGFTSKLADSQGGKAFLEYSTSKGSKFVLALKLCEKDKLAA